MNRSHQPKTHQSQVNPQLSQSTIYRLLVKLQLLPQSSPSLSASSSSERKETCLMVPIQTTATVATLLKQVEHNYRLKTKTPITCVQVFVNGCFELVDTSQKVAACFSDFMEVSVTAKHGGSKKEKKQKQLPKVREVAEVKEVAENLKAPQVLGQGTQSPTKKQKTSEKKEKVVEIVVEKVVSKSSSSSSTVELETQRLSKRESKNARKRRIRDEKQGKVTPRVITLSALSKSPVKKTPEASATPKASSTRKQSATPQIKNKKFEEPKSATSENLKQLNSDSDSDSKSEKSAQEQFIERIAASINSYSLPASGSAQKSICNSSSDSLATSSHHSEVVSTPQNNTEKGSFDDDLEILPKNKSTKPQIEGSELSELSSEKQSCKSVSISDLSD